MIHENKEKTVTAELSSIESISMADADEIHPGLQGAEFATFNSSPGAFVSEAVLVNAVEQNSPAAMNGVNTGASKYISQPPILIAMSQFQRRPGCILYSPLRARCDQEQT